jgi:rubredoxin
MASAPSDDMFDQFLSDRGHETETVGWDESYNKLQCPECGGLHDTAAAECSVCGWSPDR